MIPYGRQDNCEADIEAVRAVLKSDFLTQGPAIGQFEQTMCEATGAAHAVAVNSATSALHIACLALGVGQGDLVWTTPITFVASANAARLCGADVDFVDIEAGTFNMSADALEVKLNQARKKGRLPKAIIPVHMCGQSPDMKRISDLARNHGVAIIEDASHAVGAEYLGRPVGDCSHCNITVFSFHPVKIITSAEGGVATTQHTELASRMSELRSHGVTRDSNRMRGPSEGPWYYQQLSLGLNYRMTDMQAALGASQITRLKKFVARRRTLADAYDKLLTDLDILLPERMRDSFSAWHLYVIRLREASQRRPVFEALRADGIGVNVHYIPVHLQPYYRDLGFAPNDYPIAEDYYARAISIPLYAGLSDADQQTVVASLKKALDAQP